MPLPDFLSKPIFHAIYPIVRKRMGSPIPPIRRVVTEPDPVSRRAFDSLLDEALAKSPTVGIEYTLPYPKSDFLNYVCDWRDLVAHGSPLDNLTTLEPIRKSTDSGEFGNRQQLFASPDALWAIWFAILDKTRYRSTRNGCVRVGSGAGRVKYYHFELLHADQANPPFVPGTIYLTHAADFPDQRTEPILEFFNAQAEEWGSVKPVTPLAKISVTPQDFPYRNKVQFCM